MARPKRTEQIDLQNAVKETAWKHIAENGAAAVSLRAIARALNITAPAIYNYYPSRDDLITALIGDAYTSMGDAQFAAAAEAPTGDHHTLFMALGTAYRKWAVRYPQRYQLIFGTPIQGFHALPEATGPAAARSLVPLVRCLESAFAAGALRVPPPDSIPDRLRQELEQWAELYGVREPAVLYTTLVVWSRVHGLVSLEIGTHYPECITKTSTIFQLEMERMVREYLVYR